MLEGYGVGAEITWKMDKGGNDMSYSSLMHIAFHTDRMDEMVRFYTEVLGGKLKVVTRFGAYLERDDRPAMQAVARLRPDDVFNVYVELAPGQFIGFFPKKPGQKDHTGFNEHLGYSHFALCIPDIRTAIRELEKRGLSFDTSLSKGPSETWQIWAHDPDDNKFEIMQFTDSSWQVTGHGVTE